VTKLRIAYYCRVSTTDKSQTNETQLHALNQHLATQPDWEHVATYQDKARSQDLGRRVEWRQLLDDANKRKFDAVMVFKLDRAFRSSKHLHDTLDVWDKTNINLISVREGYDFSTPIGRVLMSLLVALAEMELSTLSERINAGLDRARAEGKLLGRPKGWEGDNMDAALEAIGVGGYSLRKAAGEFGISVRTLARERDRRLKGDGQQ